MAESEAAPAQCYESLWSAVESVETASIWTSSMMNSGMNLLMDYPEYAGTIFVVENDGLVQCNATAVLEESTWPQGPCAQKVREVMLSLAEDEGRSVVMNHWLPGSTTSGIEVDVGYPTLLADAISLAGVPSTEENELSTSVRFLDGRKVAVAEGVDLPVNGKGWGHSNATIVDERTLCDPSKGHVYVLDQALFPTGSIPEVSPTVLPQLEGYCEESLYPTLKNAGNFRPESEFALAAYTFPLVGPLTNPRTNLTIFAPERLPDVPSVSEPSVEVSADSVKKDIAVYTLLSTLPGGLCPSDFGTNGVIFNSLAGKVANESLVMLVKQDPNDANRVNIELLYGDSTSRVYSAFLLAKACHSTLYRVLEVITPWNGSTTGFSNPDLFGTWPELPNASQQDQFNVSNVCDPVIRESPMISFVDTPSSSSSSSSSSLSSGAIAGIVVGAVFGVALVALAVLWWWKRRRKTSVLWAQPGASTKCFRDSPSFNSGVTSDQGTLDSYTSARSISDYTLDDLVLKESEVTVDKDASGNPIVLGRGRFGQVFRGKLLASEPVAIKCIVESSVYSPKDPSSEDSPADSLESPGKSGELAITEGNPAAVSFCNMSLNEILKEVGLLKSCHSQYIVSFIGVLFRSHEVRLVTELMPSGDLWSALGRGGSPRTVTWYNNGIYIAMDVAAGLNYLHDKMRVIHMDLKSSNILLREVQRSRHSPSSGHGGVYTGSYQAKVSDVGLSKILPTSREYLTSADVGGTWNWCAPEVILNTKCTSAADMYSYGVVLWEICTGEIPVRGRMRDVRVPEECPQLVADLIHACLTSDLTPGGFFPSLMEGKKRRPTAAQCIALLQQLLGDSK